MVPAFIKSDISQVLPIIQAFVKTALFMYLKKPLYQRKRNDLVAATFEVVHHDTCTKRQETNAVELVQYEALIFFFTLNFIISFSK